MDHEGQVCATISSKPAPRERDRLIAELAGRQYGMIARRQLRELGLTRAEIDHRVNRARLQVVHPGVYAVGWYGTREARWMAAVLSGGSGAMLSHRSAAALGGLVAGAGPIPHVTTPRRQHSRQGIRFHRGRLALDEVTVHHGIPVSTSTRTLFDFAASADPREFERALNEADVLRLWDGLSLDDLLDRHPRHRGSRTVRLALANRRRGASVTRSELEERFVRFVDALGLPRPELNTTLDLGGETVEVDALWRAERVVVELDGRRFHDTSTAFERDRRRDRRLTAHGWRPVRVTWRQLEQERRELASDLRRLVMGSTLAA